MRVYITLEIDIFGSCVQPSLRWREGGGGRERESMNERFRGVLNRQHERIHMRGSGFIYFVRWAYNIFNPNANTHFMR
jgi:hypothetical protein